MDGNGSNCSASELVGGSMGVVCWANMCTASLSRACVTVLWTEGYELGSDCMGWESVCGALGKENDDVGSCLLSQLEELVEEVERVGETGRVWSCAGCDVPSESCKLRDMLASGSRGAL